MNPRLAPAWVIELLADGNAHLVDSQFEDAAFPPFRAWFTLTPEGQVIAP